MAMPAVTPRVGALGNICFILEDMVCVRQGSPLYGMCDVCVQVSLGEVNVAHLCEAAADQLYLLAPCQGCIQVVLATSCTPADVLMAFVHARVLALMISQNGGNDQVICLATYLFALHMSDGGVVQAHAHTCIALHQCLW